MPLGWNLRFYKNFSEQLRLLKNDVANIKIKKSQEEFERHPKTKLLICLRRVIFEDIPTDPRDSKFNLGRSLGGKYKHFKRAKNNLPPRYRLFFSYRTSESLYIIIWMNDEFSLREQGGKNDPYHKFFRMLESQQIPNEWKELKRHSEPNVSETAPSKR